MSPLSADGPNSTAFENSSHDEVLSTGHELPPPPNPSSDAGLAVNHGSTDRGVSPPSPNSIDIFTLSPITALKLLCAGIEALVQFTGDIPPMPASVETTLPNMRGMQAEKENIRRSGSWTNLAGFRQRTTGSDTVDGVNLRQKPLEIQNIVPAEPYIIVGENAEPLNVQHSAITRKFYSKKPPPISLEDYLMRIHKFCPMSTAVYLATSSYIHRVAVDERVIPVTRRNSHRLILAGLRVAMKALEDQSYAHARFSKVGGVTEQELSRLEINFCFLTNFELTSSKEALLQHAINLKELSSLQGGVNFVPKMSLLSKSRPNMAAPEAVLEVTADA
ncbi:hypothetical protein DSL72_008853 [Monilinia vaccinii-corymbosi]|uniref:Cyclin-domain-containing protein n=1 Tax=Monilinia vaccinii-corymbosi TaxID=61207 RepID=A0A8A3PSA7_9HELO|nr:hypothetical protein DSL72_008853 [Monilinia vaccinii-corymbosi]